jgi:DNA-binding NtrC family response regulator
MALDRKPKILIVDDEREVTQLLDYVLTEAGYETEIVASASELEKRLSAKEPDLVLLDLRLPDADGLDLLITIKKHWPFTEVIVLTGYATLDAAVEATKRGAYHFQQKPFDNEILLLTVKRALEHKLLTEEAGALQKVIMNLSGSMSAIFHSKHMKEVLRTVERVANSDVSILITGESGTGKEVIADIIHAMSSRSKGPFVKINCAALPRELIESELFGSVKGAYTGAQSDREGLFHQAQGGTLLLDEISEMPIDTQSKLLRVLQDKEYRPVGGKISYKADCRILATTNRKIAEAIRDGKLREDLYFRISTITIELKPLRERKEDIMPLANAFLKRYAAQAGRNFKGFTPEASQKLLEYPWPGNVRELQNEIQRAVLLSEGPTIKVDNLSAAILFSGKTEDEVEDLTLMEAIERNTIIQVLKETQGNKAQAAKRLGIGRQTLYNKLKFYGIET